MGTGPRSEFVNRIAKTYRRRSGFSINAYDLVTRIRTQLNKENYRRIQEFVDNGYEVEEPYMDENRTDDWVRVREGVKRKNWD